MNKILRLLDIRPRELPIVGSMFILLGLIITTSYIIKPVRNSLFLSQFGAERLPYVYIVVALMAGFVAAGFSRLVARYALKSVIIGAALFFAANLVVFYGAIEAGWVSTGFVFYVWVSIYTIVMPTLFWLAANYVFYSNEARRLFSVVAAGGLLGSIAGGSLTSILVETVGTSGLLVAAAVVLVVIAGVAVWVDRLSRDRLLERFRELRRQERRQFAEKDQGALTLVGRSRYLQLIVVLTVVTIVTSTLVDYQFNAVAEQSFESMDSLTGFFGMFFASINVLAFLLQLLLAGRILGRFGVGIGLIALPLALLSSSVGFLIVPGLMTAALLKASDDGLSNSINRSSVEILWLPIPLEIKSRAKAWLDMFVDRVSRGLAGLIILGVTTLLAMNVNQVSRVVLLLVASWLVLTVFLRREYVKTFRASLSRRDIDVTAVTADIQDQQSLLVLRQVLSGEDEKQILYALELLQGTEETALVEPVIRLTSHPNPSVRSAALRALASVSPPPNLEMLPELIRDENPEVSSEALELLVRTDTERGRAELHDVIHSGDVERIHAVFNRMEDNPDLFRDTVTEDFVRRYHRSTDARERETSARLAGFLPVSPELLELMPLLIADSNHDVARAAARSAGKLRAAPLIPSLLEQLPRRPVRGAVRDALARFGPEIIPTIMERFEDPSVDVALRRAIPQILTELGDQKVVIRILGHLPQGDLDLHHQSIKALSKMRTRNPRIHFPLEEVDRLIQAEGRALGALSGKHAVLSRSPDSKPSLSLLTRAVEERLVVCRDHIFRLLGLIYPPEDLYNAWNRLTHGRPPVRAAALEFLGNLLSLHHKETALSLLEASTWKDASRRAQYLYGLPVVGFDRTVATLVKGTDGWLAACAVTLVGELQMTQALEAVRNVKDHSDPLVREAAGAVLRRMQVNG